VNLRTDEAGVLLEGLGGLAVVVEDLDRPAIEAGLDADALRLHVAQRLAEAGVTVAVLDELEDDPKIGILYVRVSTDLRGGFMAVGVDLQVCEAARLARDEDLAGGVITWSTGGVRALDPGILAAQVMDEVDDGVARLVYAIREASGDTN
jgi:hypothetical protein